MTSLRNWGTGNYPAGAFSYSGTPRSVVPGYTGATPNIAVAAQEINYLLQQAGKDAAAAIAMPGVSWRAASPVATTGYTGFMAAAWDTFLNRWLIAVGASTGTGTCEVFATQGNGDPDYSVAVSSGAGIALGGRIAGVTFDGVHYFAAVIKASDASLNIYRCLPGGAWSLSLNDATKLYSEAHMTILGANILVIAGATSAGPDVHNPVYFSAIGAGGAGTWSGPTGIVTSVSNGGAVWAASPTRLVVLPITGAIISYQTSDDGGLTWATRGNFLNTKAPYGLAYSSVDQLFVCVAAGGDTKTHTFISADGVAWTEQGTGLAYLGGGCRGLGVTGGGCLVTVVEDSLGDHAIASVDAGATWHATSNLLPPAGFATLSNPRVVASPMGFFSMNSGFARLSHNAGLGPALT